jgi:Lhr-like helicase
MPIAIQTEQYDEQEILDSLHPFVREWFVNTFGTFSPPQRYAIRNIQKGMNSLISSPTGTGKTLSSFLAILNELVTRADTGTLDDKVYCIYISPLKALANDINRNLTEPLAQINEIANKYRRDLLIRVGTRTGDTTQYERTKMLAKPPHILITTPESLAIALSSIKFSKMIESTRYLIIDEIHALAENKRGIHLALSIERLARRAQFTRIGLSATVAPLEEVAKFLVGYDDPRQKIFRDCAIVDVQHLKKLDLKVLSPVEDIINTTHNRMQDATYQLLHDLIQAHRTTLIFTNTRAGTERVVHQLRERYPASYANVLDADDEQEKIAKHEGGLLHPHLETEAELNVMNLETHSARVATDLPTLPQEKSFEEVPGIANIDVRDESDEHDVTPLDQLNEMGQDTTIDNIKEYEKSRERDEESELDPEISTSANIAHYKTIEHTAVPSAETAQEPKDADAQETVKHKMPKNLIGAHHGSLSKQHRMRIENMLKAGELRSVVCSTSLELGIDIGFIDLVVLLGSPKSVARALQRIGRSGHKLHEEAKGRIIVMDRDDLVECSVLLKAAIEKKIDRINIPKNALDVLAQQLFGMAIEDVTRIEDAWETVTSSYAYDGLTRKDFDETLKYLSGEFAQLSERNIYGKIWIDREAGTFGKKGKLARLIYMTNIGTIPDESVVQVKINEHTIGTITEDFAERLKPGDIFVLGGDPYEFRFSRGMTAQVKTSAGRMPTVPNWVSEMLPLSYDLALEIQKFRKYMDQWFSIKKPKKEICDWLREYLYVDERGIEAIYRYFNEQYRFMKIPHQNRMLLEHFKDGNKKYVFVHAVYGRRVNDVLARAVAYVNARVTGRDVEIGITDNGFYLKSMQPIQALRALKLIREEELHKLMEIALEKSEVLRRRFRHCAARALMILRTYKGQSKSVGRQQISSQLIMNAVRRISNDFPILKEARREILEDHMDIHHAIEVVRQIQSGGIVVEERNTDLPSPFAFNMVIQGYVDILKMEDRIEFVRRMHKLVIEEIEGKRLRREEKENLMPAPEFTYERLWQEQEAVNKKKEEDYQGFLKDQLRKVSTRIGLEADIYYHANRLIDGEREGYPEKFKTWLHTLLSGTVPKLWPDELVKFFIERERML